MNTLHFSKLSRQRRKQKQIPVHPIAPFKFVCQPFYTWGKIPLALANPQKHLQWKKLLVCVRVTSPIGKQYYDKNRTLCQWMPYTHTTNLQWCLCSYLWLSSRIKANKTCVLLESAGLDWCWEVYLGNSATPYLVFCLPCFKVVSVPRTSLCRHSEHQQVLTHLRKATRTLLLRLMSHLSDS